MTALTAGLTRTDEAMDGKQWSIRDICIQAKSVSDDAVIYLVICEPTQFVPVHIHPEVDQVMMVQEGELQVKLDGMWLPMGAGDLMRIPRGVPHGFFNTSQQRAKVLIIMTPSAKVRQMLDALDGISDTQQVMAIAARYGMDILPLDANE